MRPAVPSAAPSAPPASPRTGRLATDTLATQGAPPSSVRLSDLVSKVQAAQAQPQQPSSAIDDLFEKVGNGFEGGVDRFEAAVERNAHAMADGVAGVPVLAEIAQAQAWLGTEAAQILGGVAKGAGGFVGGIALMVAHPVDTVKGLYALAEHIPLLPLNPFRAAHAAYDIAFEGADVARTLDAHLNPVEVFKSDAAFGKALVKGLVEPYAQAIDQGKYAEALGRGVFEIGSLVLGSGTGASAKGAAVSKAAGVLDDTGRVLGKVAGKQRVAKLLGSEYALAGESAFKRFAAGLNEQKALEAGRAMNAERAARLAKLNGAAFFDEIKAMPVEKLKELAKLEPAVIDRFDVLLESRQRVGLRDINAALAKHGVKASGPTKQWESALGKAQKESLRQAASGAKTFTSLGDLHDLNRARVNVTRFQPEKLRAMADDVMNELKTRYPDRQFRFVLKDEGLADEVLRNPDQLYKGRINLRIHDVTGGVQGGAFELQLGPQQVTDFWEKPFRIGQGPNDFNLHDAVYKGVDAIKQPEDLARVGRAFNPAKPLAADEALAAGKAAVAGTMDAYKLQLADALAQAEAGVPLNYAGTRALRDRIATIYHALEDSPTRPPGLAGVAP
ncbi:MAG TPA: hypothetical protein V6D00_10540 [Pantanalinema sp.]